MKYVKTQIGVLAFFSSSLVCAATMPDSPTSGAGSYVVPNVQMLLSQLTFAPLSQQAASNSTDKKPNYFLTPSKKQDSLGRQFGWTEGDDVQYATFRSGGDVYLKGRAGYLTDYTKQSFEEISIEEVVNEFDKNGALGFGAGYTLKNGTKLEFDYTVTKRAEQILQVEYLF